MASHKVSEKLDKCTVILDADTEDDLETQLQGLKIDVPPRAQGPATDAREQWQMHQLLRALLAARQLITPVRLYKREAPDFVLQNRNIRIGVEITEAINPDYVQAQMHPAAQRDDAVVDPSLYKWAPKDARDPRFAKNPAGCSYQAILGWATALSRNLRSRSKM